LHSFSGTDGAAPYGSLLLATNGDFYGTANVGGAYGAGTVFTIASSGALTTLYNFCAQSGCTDGQYPVGPLIQGTDGDIYGITYAGGDYAPCNVDGCGTVYKITLSGKLTTLHIRRSCRGRGQDVLRNHDRGRHIQRWNDLHH
jgi:uncharacterized repeat protein (TIGR03803 family)